MSHRMYILRRSLNEMTYNRIIIVISRQVTESEAVKGVGQYLLFSEDLQTSLAFM